MPFRTVLLRAALGAVAALSLAPVAQAASIDICVRPAARASCDPDLHTWDTIGAALGDAKANANGAGEQDRIFLGEKTYAPQDAGDIFIADSPVELIGAGRGKTVIEAEGSNYVLWLQAHGSTARNMTVKWADSNRWAVPAKTALLENLEIISTDDNVGGHDQAAILLESGPSVVRDVRIVAPVGSGINTWGIEISHSDDNLIENTSIKADNGVLVIFGGATGNVLRNSTIEAHRGVTVPDRGDITLDTVTIRSIDGSSPTNIALNANANNGTTAALTARNTTVVGDGSGYGANSTVNNESCAGPPTGVSRVTLQNTVINGFLHGVRAVGCNNACPAAAGSASITAQHSVYSGGFSTNGGCNAIESLSFSSNPGFVSATDLRPRWITNSPLIDKGDPAAFAEPTVDAAGRARLVDGDAAGGARRDIGAYEYQRQAPTVSASANPGSGPLSTTFGFTASASDPDGDSVQYIWTFDDGMAFAKSSVDKTFATLGTHTGTVQAQDAAGVISSASASVDVTNGVVTPPPPAPPAPPVVQDVTGPNATVKGGTLRVDKKRKATVTISCPASESAPCKIDLGVNSAKKIKIGKGKKKIQALGKGSGSVQPGKSAKVTFTLTKKAYSYLKRKKKLAVRINVAAADAAGNSTKSSAKATLRPAKAKKKKRR